MHDDILTAIANAFPYPIHIVDTIYDNVKSYDMTILIMKIAIAVAGDPVRISEMIKEARQ